MEALLLQRLCATANSTPYVLLRLLFHFTSKELLRSVATVKIAKTKNQALLQTHWKHPKASSIESHVGLF